MWFRLQFAVADSSMLIRVFEIWLSEHPNFRLIILMGKLKVILPAILLAALIVWAIPAILRAMPDRYVVRLPEPLQQMGLPEDTVAILPTVDSPSMAIELLQPSFEALTPSPISTIKSTHTTAKEVISTPDSTGNYPSNNPSSAEPTIAPSVTPSPSPTPWPLPPSARLTGFQHKFQTWNNCGPATLAMALTYFGLDTTQEETAVILKPNPEDRNVSPNEMAAYVNQQTAYKAIWRSNGSPELLRRFIANGIPVIIEIGIEPPGEFRWMGWYGHYLLVVAYDDDQEQYWVYDSWFGTSEEPLTNAHADGRALTYEELEKYWPQFLRNYIALYEPHQAELVENIIGVDIEDEKMWERALDTVKADLALEPENPFHWFNLGTTYNALEQYQDAATAFDQARSLGLPWRMLWYQFGPYDAYFQTGRYEDMLLLANVTLKDRPYFEESFYYKGLALAAMDDKKEAINQFEKALSFNPNFVAAAKALAELSGP